MKPTKVSRGRPKKERIEVQQVAASQPESIAFVNKRFIDKNGHVVSSVYYSGCKAKPIDIRFGT